MSHVSIPVHTHLMRVADTIRAAYPREALMLSLCASITQDLEQLEQLTLEQHTRAKRGRPRKPRLVPPAGEAA